MLHLLHLCLITWPPAHLCDCKNSNEECEPRADLPTDLPKVPDTAGTDFLCIAPSVHERPSVVIRCNKCNVNDKKRCHCTTEHYSQCLCVWMVNRRIIAWFIGHLEHYFSAIRNRCNFQCHWCGDSTLLKYHSFNLQIPEFKSHWSHDLVIYL